MLKIEINGGMEKVTMEGTLFDVDVDMLRVMKLFNEHLKKHLGENVGKERMTFLFTVATLPPEELAKAHEELERKLPERVQKAEDAFWQYIKGRN